jgi:hypothetical protein
MAAGEGEKEREFNTMSREMGKLFKSVLGVEGIYDYGSEKPHIDPLLEGGAEGQGLSSSMSTMMNSVIDAFKALVKGIQYVGTSLKNLPKNVATATMSVCKAIVDGAKLLGKSPDRGDGKRSLMKHVLSVVYRKMSNLFKAMSKNATGKEMELCDAHSNEYMKIAEEAITGADPAIEKAGRKEKQKEGELRAISKLKGEEMRAKLEGEEFRDKRRAQQKKEALAVKVEGKCLTKVDDPATEKRKASLAAFKKRRGKGSPEGLRI